MEKHLNNPSLLANLSNSQISRIEKASYETEQSDRTLHLFNLLKNNKILDFDSI